MRRIKVILAVVAAVATMMVLSAPAMAQTCCDDFDNLGNCVLTDSGVVVCGTDFFDDNGGIFGSPVDDSGVAQGFDMSRITAGEATPTFTVSNSSS